MKTHPELGLGKSKDRARNVVAYLKSHRPSAASARTHPVCPLSSTLSCISEQGGSQTAMLFAAFPQNTCTRRPGEGSAVLTAELTPMAIHFH